MELGKDSYNDVLEVTSVALAPRVPSRSDTTIETANHHEAKVPLTFLRPTPIAVINLP